MRHFILLLIIFVAFFFVWKAATKPERRQAKKAARNYGWPIAIATIVLLVGMIAAFYGRAINIL